MVRRAMHTAMAVLAAVVMGAGNGAAGDASVSLDVASAYVFRGGTLNEGAVAQPGLEVAGLPVTLGVWGNIDIDDYDGTLEEGQFSEVDLYASYDLPLDLDKLALSVGYTEYLYPTAGGEPDREVSLTAALGLPLAPSVSVYYGLDGAIDESVYIEAGVGHGHALTDDVTLELGATIGYLDPETGEDGFSHFTASLGLGWQALSAEVTYVGQVDDDVLPDVEDGGAYDVEVYGTLGISHDF